MPQDRHRSHVSSAPSGVDGGEQAGEEGGAAFTGQEAQSEDKDCGAAHRAQAGMAVVQ